MTNCSQCGTPNAPEASYCEKCGQPLATSAVPATPASSAAVAARTNPLAVASLLLGFFSVFPLFGILAVVFGHLARSQVRKSAGQQKGAGMAMAGLILGYLGLGFILFVILVAIPNLNWHSRDRRGCSGECSFFTDEIGVICPRLANPLWPRQPSTRMTSPGSIWWRFIGLSLVFVITYDAC